MTLRLPGHFSMFGLDFFVLYSLMGIARQWSRKKFAIYNLTLKPLSHIKILIYRASAIYCRGYSCFLGVKDHSFMMKSSNLNYFHYI